MTSSTSHPGHGHEPDKPDKNPAAILLRPVTVHVNERPVRLPDHTQVGAEIKAAAIAQGVPIQQDFVLTEEIGPHRTRVIGDDEAILVTKHSRFLANDGDDNS